MKFTVAIDGPAAAGKGTLSRALAKSLGFAYLDTGAIYRAVAAKALETGGRQIDPTFAARVAINLSDRDLNRSDLRTAKVGQAASKIAAMPEVRAALLEFQKMFARRNGGAILDGRDIGTVICPEAEVKLFVTASDEIRAERRLKELQVRNPDLTHADVLADLIARDTRDASRDVAPMKPAPDALLLDTTKLSIDAAVAEALALIKERIV